MISSERRPSSSERTRPSSSVSENIRICASGVRSSWDTPDTKSVRRRASSYSRRSWTRAVTMSPAVSPSAPRSEEHTSELQSHSDLVCRLLLEKKNIEKKTIAKTQLQRKQRTQTSNDTNHILEIE